MVAILLSFVTHNVRVLFKLGCRTDYEVKCGKPFPGQSICGSRTLDTTTSFWQSTREARVRARKISRKIFTVVCLSTRAINPRRESVPFVGFCKPIRSRIQTSVIVRYVSLQFGSLHSQHPPGDEHSRSRHLDVSSVVLRPNQESNLLY
jgi:hypothetical protein